MEDGRSVFDMNIGSIRTIMKPGTGINSPGAAILILNPELREMEPSHQNPNMATAMLVGDRRINICLISTYFKFNMPTTGFVQLLREKLINYPTIIIGADINAHSELWHCPKVDAKRKIIK